MRELDLVCLLSDFLLLNFRRKKRLKREKERERTLLSSAVAVFLFLLLLATALRLVNTVTLAFVREKKRLGF